MSRRAFILTLVLALGAAYAGRLAWRAHQDIVTLAAYDLPLREVVKKLRWQTWEDIKVNKEVDGRVTLRVENQPLAVVLDLISEQIGTRWALAYPLYTSKPKLATVRQIALGTLEWPQPGWTNWNARPNFAAMAARAMAAATNTDGATPGGAPGGPGAFAGFGGPGGPGGNFDELTDIKPVTVEWAKTPPLEAAQTLRRFGRVKVVPEDGTSIPVSLTLKDVPMDTAVAKLAKATNRKWAKFYAFEPQRRGPRPTDAEREQFAQQMPDRDQMRQRFEQMAQDPNFQARMEQREVRSLLNSTPYQRAERDKRRAQGGRGGPGGPGGGRGGGGPGR
ncbi:MAG TPA: hypothetical protein PLX89_11250 [Verrucomicrobiota bacterium]|nr:hypothetical protein [Verrucomicrobiota bacterium]